jgi:Transcription factor WhiB
VIVDGVLYKHGKVEGDKLTRAILEAAASGLRPHCSDVGTGGLWLSDHEAERAEAAKLCVGCPVIEPCGQAATARRERFGVWGGVDVTRPPGRKATRSTSIPAA